MSEGCRTLPEIVDTETLEAPVSDPDLEIIRGQAIQVSGPRNHDRNLDQAAGDLLDVSDVEDFA
jgi:hypothetical protein